jgi:hypothetical protein
VTIDVVGGGTTSDGSRRGRMTRQRGATIATGDRQAANGAPKGRSIKGRNNRRRKRRTSIEDCHEEDAAREELHTPSITRWLV